MKKLISIILLLSTTTHSDNSVPASVQFVTVGRTVKIPCKGYGNHSVATWLYRREDTSYETIFSERNGRIYFGQRRIRKKPLRDFYLEFRPFTKEDKGIYVCKLCKNTMGCTYSQAISLIPQYEKDCPTLKTHFIIEGGRFSYTCLHNQTHNGKVGWTFKVEGGHTLTHVNSELTDRALLSIPYVQPSHSGIYRCWRETLTGQWETGYSLTLCVLTVSAEEMTDSPQNCTLYCDVDVDAERDPITVGTDKGNISVTGKIKKPKSSVICRINSRDVEANRTSVEEHNTFQAGATEDRTLSHTAVPISAACAAAFFIIVALVIILWSLRQRGMTERISCRESQSHTRESVQDECETQVIYSTLEFSKHRQPSVITSDHECVYSQIRV
ncbi:uncharacterized protein LOC103026807 [Astyanax mexicanus]|uniref:uncharacterized protein LOC103026807 n=1 Tax=Astyanax mexicanus TaxID=7994 RepID=UPI0020CB2ED4|nr:uncharacterized protein LOC103026807 [Astyanax mexicanus]